ncbi:unnamed protein product [Ectocarpus fasciculatus]
MPRWAGFRRQGRDELFKIDRNRLGASDAVAAAVKEVYTTAVAAAFPVVGYNQPQWSESRHGTGYKASQCSPERLEKISRRSRLYYTILHELLAPARSTLDNPRAISLQRPHTAVFQRTHAQHLRSPGDQAGSRKTTNCPRCWTLCVPQNLATQGVCEGVRDPGSVHHPSKRVCVGHPLLFSPTTERGVPNDGRDGFGTQVAVDRQRGEHQDRDGPLHPG